MVSDVNLHLYIWDARGTNGDGDGGGGGDAAFGKRSATLHVVRRCRLTSG